ncbi:MAG: hypothetical protein UY36_C0004G0004 [Parcubacteria group bacterium GW2011_GWA1_49_11]|nr:MAG: hypothetical protein UY36_C0004G0004 [Parcubacteria group bacterium GW2011_GWA1_49_11]
MVRKEAVVTIVEFGDEVLVVKKVDDDGASLMSDKWHLPGETKQDGEPDEYAVRRGIYEEASVLVTGIVYVASSRTPKDTSLKWYRCKALSRQIVPGDDVVDGKWVDRKNVPYVCDKVSVELWPKEIREYFRLVD